MTRQARGTALAVGAALCLAFFGLSQTATGLTVGFYHPFTQSTPGGFLFWLGHAMLLLPGMFLLGFGLSPQLEPMLRRLFHRLEKTERSERIAGLVIVFIVAAATASISHLVFMRDFPVTDDEGVARFGGQILAMGQLTIDAPEPLSAFPKTYVYARAGALTSMDWLGGQLVWALAELSGLGSTLFALIAAVTPVALAVIVGKRVGAAWGLFAAVVALASPMAVALSASTHAHLSSRALLAVALCLFIVARKRRNNASWAWCGLAFAAAFLCRPIEIAMLSAPLLLGELWAARRGEHFRATLGGLLLGGLPILVLLAAHNHLITGHAWLPARMAPNEIPVSLPAHGFLAAFGDAAIFWERFGAGTGYNTFLLGVWFLGPLGALLVAAGVLHDRFTKLLGLGIALALLFNLAHDNHGIHAVGPIHYSECVVPLTVIATHGLKRLVDRAGELEIAVGRWAAGLATALVSFCIFNVHHGMALRRQAYIQEYVYGVIERANIHRAILLADRFARVWTNIPGISEPQSWVTEWRYPAPDFSEDVIILHDAPDVVAPLRKVFPQRTFYRLMLTLEPPYLAVVPIAPTES